MKILLVEDDFINRLTVERMLEKEGHFVIPASNGREAIRALTDETVDLVLMDISMPEMDGIEATALVRSGDSEAADPTVPIIAMTAHAMPEDRIAYRDAGMDGFVEKPVDMKELLETVRAISLPGGTDAEQKTKPASPPAGRNDDNDDKPDILDQQWLLERYEGDAELVAEVYQIFTEDAPLRLKDLRRALDAGDDTSAVKAVHALKGMSATIGARPAAAVAAEIEACGRQGHMDSFREKIGELIEAVDTVVACIDEM